jgi:quercetin dioxygenase-like cupin family protein
MTDSPRPNDAEAVSPGASHSSEGPSATRTSGSGQRDARVLASSLRRVTISHIAEQLRAEAAYATDGRNSRTIVHEGEARVVVTAIGEGRDVGSTTSDGPVALVIVAGTGTLTQGDQQVELRGGDLATLAPGGAWRFEARAETALVACFWQPG